MYMKNCHAVTSKARKRQSCDAPICTELLEIIRRAHAVRNDRMLRLPRVKEMIGKAYSTIWKDVKEGLLPPPIPIGARSVAWKESELQACNDARVFTSRTNEPLNMAHFVAILIDPSSRVSALIEY
jgi:prophage regulatory protein